MEHDDRGINETRGYACEIVAWRFLTHSSEHDLIDYLLSNLPGNGGSTRTSSDIEADGDTGGETGESFKVNEPDEAVGLLWNRRPAPAKRPQLLTQGLSYSSRQGLDGVPNSAEKKLISGFVGLNALEIASVANAKKFLSQRVVQKVVNDIWSGRIVFWESLTIHTKKRAQVDHKRYVILYFRYFLIGIIKGGSIELHLIRASGAS